MKPIEEMTLEELHVSLASQGANTRRQKRTKLKEEDEKEKPCSTLEIAEIIKATVPTVKLGKHGDDGGQIAIYHPEKGIYLSKQGYIFDLIHQVEPSATRRKHLEVIFILERIVPIAEENTDKRFVAVANGIYLRHKHTLMPFNSKYIFTNTIATNYNPNATESPEMFGITVDDFISQLMTDEKGNPDPEKEKTMWQVMSACICGKSYRKAVFFIGNGNDGKGTAQQLITNVIGAENVGNLKINLFDKQFMLSTIIGKRCIIGDDVQAGSYLEDSSNFNSWVTGDSVMVEKKNGDPYFIYPKSTIVQSTNEMPLFRNKSNGTDRRILPLFFHGAFKQTTGDNWKIKDEFIHLTEVKEYVLKKVLEMEFTEFHFPQESFKLLEEFRLVNDNVLAFLTEIELDKVQSTVIPVPELFKVYQHWCKVGGYQPVSQRVFSGAIKKHLSGKWELKNYRPEKRFNPYDFGDIFRLNLKSWDEKKTQKCFVKL